MRLGWLSHPTSTGAGWFAVLEGTFFLGKGRGFHYHANQEELSYVVSSTIEHWIEQEKRILSPSDSVFMPQDRARDLQHRHGGCQGRFHSRAMCRRHGSGAGRDVGLGAVE